MGVVVHFLQRGHDSQRRRRGDETTIPTPSANNYYFQTPLPPTFTLSDWLHFSLSIKYLNFTRLQIYGRCAYVLRQWVRMPQSRAALQHEAVKDFLHNCVTIFILCNSPQLAGKLTYLKEHCFDPVRERNHTEHCQRQWILEWQRGNYHR